MSSILDLLPSVSTTSALLSGSTKSTPPPPQSSIPSAPSSGSSVSSSVAPPSSAPSQIPPPSYYGSAASYNDTKLSENVEYLAQNERDKDVSFWDQASSTDKFLIIAVLLLLFFLFTSQVIFIFLGYYLESRIKRTIVISAVTSSRFKSALSNARSTLRNGVAGTQTQTTSMGKRLQSSVRNTRENFSSKLNQYALNASNRVNHMAAHSTYLGDRYVRVGTRSIVSGFRTVRRGLISAARGIFSVIMPSLALLIPAGVINPTIQAIINS